MVSTAGTRVAWTVTLALSLTCTSCKVGSARELDVRRDLSGIDLQHLRDRASAESEKNSQSIEGELSGWPFWFAPAVTLRYAGSNSLHRGEAQMPASDDAAPTAKLSGFEHRSGSALGLGVALYNNEQGTWRPDGSLDRWTSSWGVGWGLLYCSETSGGSNGLSDRRSAKFLRGAVGYTRDEQQSTLHVLWLPIPIW